MRQAAVPGDHQEFVAGEKLTQDVRVWKNGADDEHPSGEAFLAHFEWREHVAATEDGFAHQRACNSVGDRVHRLLVGELAN